MIEVLILVEGKNVQVKDLNISLLNAKQVVVGSVINFGMILHVAASSADDLRNVFADFAKVKDVTGVVTLMLRSPQ